MKTISLAAAAMLIVAAGTVTRAEPAHAAVTVVASAATGTVPTAATPTDTSATDKKVTPAPTASSPTPAVPAETAKDTTKPIDTVNAAPKKAETPIPPKRPSNIRSAKFTNGAGSIRKSSHHGYDFIGTYGGCHFSGYVTRSGYHLDRSC